MALHVCLDPEAHDWQTITLQIKGRGALTTEAHQECQQEGCHAARVVPRRLVDAGGDA